MHVKEIAEVKDRLDHLKERGMLENWDLPYENLLTRLDASIFFIVPAGTLVGSFAPVWSELARFSNFSYRTNVEKKLSDLPYRITFSEEEKKKNSN